MYDNFSLALYTTISPIFTDYPLSILVLGSVSMAWYFYSKKMNNTIKRFEREIEQWKRHSSLADTILESTKNAKKEVKEYAEWLEGQNNLLKKQLELEKEIHIHKEKVFVSHSDFPIKPGQPVVTTFSNPIKCKEKKTWSKKKPGTLSRSQEYRRRKKIEKKA